MSLEQLATLFNMTGLGSVLLVYFLVFPKAPRSFFTPWLKAYGCGLGLSSLAYIGMTYGQFPAVTLAWTCFVAAAGWYFAETSATASDTHLPRWSFPAWVAVSLLSTGFALFHGIAYPMAAVLPVLALSGAVIWLAVLFLRKRVSGSAAMSWLGVPLILTGLLPFVFPIVAATRYSWIGYWLGGPINLLTGIGMLVFRLELLATELKLKNQELMRLDELKTNFLHTISHEIRTPLTAIRAVASMPAAAGETKAPLPFMAMINANALQLERLFDDILDFAKMETGLISFQLERGDLGEAVQRACDAQAHAYVEAGIELVVDMQEASIDADFDTDRMCQVVSNLLQNASRFTPKQGSVTVKASTLADGGSRIEVSDNGIGIAPENRLAVFDKFYQVDNGASRKVGGTGLGLAICKAIVEDGHGGRIWVEGAAGLGSTFIIELPKPETPVAKTAAITGSLV